MTTRVKKSLPLLIILVLSFFSIRPFFHSGFFPIHDHTQVIRVQQMAESLRDGQFPVRWVKDLGYGYSYPIFNFYAPLPYYLGASFNLLGFDVLTATKIMMSLGILLAGFSMYFLAKEFWGESGGILAALFYVYAPYHAVDIYIRGAVGEFWAIAFLPLLFLGIYKVVDENGLRSGSRQIKWILISSLSFAAIILSHNLTAFMTIPFLFIFIFFLVIFSKDKKYSILYTLYSILLALGLSAFYWLPALLEKNLTKVNQMIAQTKTWEHLVYWDQFWSSPWLFAGSTPGRADAMSFMVGKLHLIFSVLSLLLSITYFCHSGLKFHCHSGLDPESIKIKNKKRFFIISTSFLFLLISLFLSSQFSFFIWQNLRFLDILQYPWRFLIFVVLFSSFLAGSISLLTERNHLISFLATGIIIGLLLCLSLKYFQPKEYFQTSASDYLREENLKWFTSKISDEYLPKDFPIPINEGEVAWEKVKILRGEAAINHLVSQSHRLSFNIRVKKETEILVNNAYFPGWEVRVNGEKIDFTLDGAKPQFSLSPGDYQILLSLTNTPARTLANLISLVSWLCLGAHFFIQKKKESKIFYSLFFSVSSA